LPVTWPGTGWARRPRHPLPVRAQGSDRRRADRGGRSATRCALRYRPV